MIKSLLFVYNILGGICILCTVLYFLFYLKDKIRNICNIYLVCYNLMVCILKNNYINLFISTSPVL